MNKFTVAILFISSLMLSTDVISNESLTKNWVYTHKGSLCEETYSFNKDGTYRITSQKEIIDGTYKIIASNGSSRHKLNFLSSHDNGLQDCYGKNRKIDLTSLNLFIETKNNELLIYENNHSSSPILRMVVMSSTSQ